MNDFNGKKYKIIKNFISTEKAKDLAKQFEKFCEDTNPEPDNDVPNSPAVRNFLPFVELLSTKTKKISKLIGETVLPSYCYSRLYKNNSVLESHKDRDSCEVSLTVHLDGDESWSIYFEDENGRKYIDLDPGDAILYYGIDITHGRDHYLGEKYIQCFLHYVKLNGEYSDNFFDRKIFETKPIDFHRNIGDYIAVYNNALSNDLCDQIIKEYSDDEYENSITFDERDNYRTNKQVSISEDFVIEQNPKVRKYIDDKIFELLTSNINNYFLRFLSSVTDLNDEGYHLLKYDIGEFYNEHVDACGQNSIRTLSCSIILNDDYEGGKLKFFNGNYEVEAKKGDMILFPSNFMFPHQVTPVTKGVRYSIVTWIK